MSNEQLLPPEITHARLFDKWYEDSRKLIASYRQHGIPVPKLLESVVKPIEGQAARSLVILPPARPDAPTRAKGDWIWIDNEEASPQTIVLALLNEGKPFDTKQIIDRVGEIYKKEFNRGVVYNAVARLTGKKIKKSGKSLELIAGQEAPILHGGHIWAPTGLLSVQEQAAHRRMCVRHLMRAYPDGIKLMEIVKILNGVDWLNTPKSKDLIDDDLKSGVDVWCRQMGRSKKWKLISEDEKK